MEKLRFLHYSNEGGIVVPYLSRSICLSTIPHSKLSGVLSPGCFRRSGGGYGRKHNFDYSKNFWRTRSDCHQKQLKHLRVWDLSFPFTSRFGRDVGQPSKKTGENKEKREREW